MRNADAAFSGEQGFGNIFMSLVSAQFPSWLPKTHVFVCLNQAHTLPLHVFLEALYLSTHLVFHTVHVWKELLSGRSSHILSLDSSAGCILMFSGATFLFLLFSRIVIVKI